jgi:preprotein translocase subunit SecA
MRSWWRSLITRASRPSDAPDLDAEGRRVRESRDRHAKLGDAQLKAAAHRAVTLPEFVGVAAVVASRVLGLHMFDVQIEGALALAHGRIVEMQTGEGKTLAAVPAAAWLARTSGAVHVLTANDYLASRDAAWMSETYRWLGLRTAAIGQASTIDQRRDAYAADVMYATAQEVGFDHLRDGLALDPLEQVQRPFGAALIDEVDSILIDEARVPLVIAGGVDDAWESAVMADRIVRELEPSRHYVVEASGRQVLLTPAGVSYVERAIGCANLFDPDQLTRHIAIQDALHAHTLLRRDVDYVVADHAIVSVDEFKGRMVRERRWPAGLQTALECKERVPPRAQGCVLGSITIEHLVRRYASLCGMTGTAATQADEFRDVYGLDVHCVPTHRPVRRDDRPDRWFATRAEKESAVVREILDVHAMRRPVLIGTASVAESERLSRALGSMPHQVLNARHEAMEAELVARAGEAGAITVSTNMAGRGVDIRLGDGVAALGGLHVIGTNRHESRRIDHQLRGRAGRQGDPGSSQFFVSREDPLILRAAPDDADATADHCQRVIEGENRDIRIFLRKYESVLEGQRIAMASVRQDILTGVLPSAHDGERRLRLMVIDELWSDYLAATAELRAGTAWVSLGYGNALGHYLGQVHRMFAEMQREIDREIGARLAIGAGHVVPKRRGATWTYLTTDEPFGPMTERILRRLVGIVRASRQRRARAR